MNFFRTITPAILLFMLAMLPGCNSKKEQAEQVPLPQPVPAAPTKTGGVASPSKAAIVIPTQDEADAVALNKKVMELLLANDFAAIYKNASDGFKKVGTEKAFVELWQKQLQQTGPFREAKEVSFAVRAEDKALATIYKVQYEKASKSVRLITGRSKGGKMELIGINQRDPK